MDSRRFSPGGDSDTNKGFILGAVTAPAAAFSFQRPFDPLLALPAPRRAALPPRFVRDSGLSLPSPPALPDSAQSTPSLPVCSRALMLLEPVHRKLLLTGQPQGWRLRRFLSALASLGALPSTANVGPALNAARCSGDAVHSVVLPTVLARVLSLGCLLGPVFSEPVGEPRLRGQLSPRGGGCRQSDLRVPGWARHVPGKFGAATSSALRLGPGSPGEKAPGRPRVPRYVGGCKEDGEGGGGRTRGAVRQECFSPGWGDAGDAAEAPALEAFKARLDDVPARSRTSETDGPFQPILCLHEGLSVQVICFPFSFTRSCPRSDPRRAWWPVSLFPRGSAERRRTGAGGDCRPRSPRSAAPSAPKQLLPWQLVPVP